jgi:hypothetical protein
MQYCIKAAHVLTLKHINLEFQTINVQPFLYNYNNTYYNHPPRKTTYLKYYGIALIKERHNITIYPN